MSADPINLESLLEQINSGHATAALPELDRLQTQLPTHPGVLSVRAEALRLAGRSAEAIETFKQAGERGAGPRCWLAAGILLAAERATDQSLQCLSKAYAETPDSEEVLDALITTLFNGNRHREGIEYARQQLRVSNNPNLLSRAALMLQANDLYEDSSAAFKKIVSMALDNPALIGAALVPARFNCEWEWTESLQEKISAWYAQGEFKVPQEFPLTHLTWCPDEAWNLGVTRAYHNRTIPKVDPIGSRAARAPRDRIRVGYLSCDFRNHATMHLMAGVFEHHDRDRFEVFAYDYTSPDISEYRQRFLDAVEHQVPIHSMSDRQAAARIAADEIDILFDLKLYTGGGRSGIMSYRPAPVQAAYIGFPGSGAHPEIDYIVSDRFVTPDSSAAHYTEKFCRLPHSYQCNDSKRYVAPQISNRAAQGLPDNKVVFAVFNQSYKIDRGSFAVWMRILQEVPDSVLWLLGQSESAKANLLRHAQMAGIGAERIIYAPFAAPIDHAARLPVADAVLDALICNGHTTTSDALWAGVPVITARGKHFASRVSESLLNAVGLSELVGSDHDDMIRIAKRLGTDAVYRATVRQKAAANRSTAPLFDTARFTRDFEAGISMMVERNRNGLDADHIDVPDHGPVDAAASVTKFRGRVSSLQTAYLKCPLCDGLSSQLGFANCTSHKLWHEPLPPTIEWVRCSSCSHVHSRNHWTPEGVAEIRSLASPSSAELQRSPWTGVVDKVAGLLGGYAALLDRETRPVWVDAGCGEGSLILTASDSGFATVGLENYAPAATRAQSLGLNVLHNDFLTLKFEITLDVLSLMDVLAQMAFPREALRKAHDVLRPGGVLVVSTPDFNSSTWKVIEAQKSNPYWTDLERAHHFTRDRLVTLLRDSGFEVADLALSPRAAAEVEIYAVRKS